MSDDRPLFVPSPIPVAHPKTAGEADWHTYGADVAHLHIISEDWPPEKKNRVANHIDIWHSWRSG